MTKGEGMNELKHLLEEKLGWVMETRGATHVNVKLTGDQLARLINLLAPVEMVGSNLPKIEPRMLA